MCKENGRTSNGNGNGNGDLTGLQRRFVDEWFKDFNGTRAAERAGYQGDDSTLATTASRTLRIAKVKRAIAQRWEGHGASRDEVIARLTGWMRFDPGVLYDEHGRIQWEQVRKHARNIKRIEYETGRGFKVEVHDPMRAAEIAAKHLLVDEAQETGLEIVVDV